MFLFWIKVPRTGEAMTREPMNSDPVRCGGSDRRNTSFSAPFPEKKKHRTMNAFAAFSLAAFHWERKLIYVPKAKSPNFTLTFCG